MMKKTLATLALFGAILSVKAQKQLNIVDYGAKVENANNAAFIQKAIDEASKNGGGTVLVPSGHFVTGPIVLKNNVNLHVTPYGILAGTVNRADFGGDKMALITAYNKKNISITGNGVIDGQAHELVISMFEMLRSGQLEDAQWLVKRPTESSRPNLIFLKGCENVKVKGITLKNAANWVQNYKECTNVEIDSMKVISYAYWNNDGIDIVDSKNVTIRNSYFNAADDAICLKSEIPNGSCENVLVENCIARSSASAFKIGTGSLGGFKKITVKNLTVFDTYRSAVAIETVDGGFLEDVTVSNVKAKNTGNAIFIRLGHRNKDERYSSIKNVLIENVQIEVPNAKPDIGYPLEGPAPKVAPHNLVPSSITGLEGHLVENVTLKNITISYGGGAKKEKAFVSLDSLSSVTENISGYPEFTMFGELPSWGLYVRHVKGLKLENFNIELKDKDFRPAFVFDDAKDIKLNGVNVSNNADLPTIVYKNVANVSESKVVLPKGANAIIRK